MNLRNVDLNLLTIFDAIMTERNMTRAAERVGMTQPAISNALSRLRALTGDPLFTRTAKVWSQPRGLMRWPSLFVKRLTLSGRA